MTSAQRLVNRIREFVKGFEQEPTPLAQDLALQFHDLCRELNERLAKCNDFLDKGRRSEAVQEALSQPPVFELTSTLDFEELKNWRNLCIDLSMPPPPELDFETVDRLKDECSTEQLMAPLLKEFRHLVHTGERDERIRVLRRIREYDSDNPVWRQNLEPLERERLEDEIAEAKQAVASENEDRLRELHGDMTDPNRVVKAPPELIRQMEGVLRRKREAVAAEEGERLVAQLEEAREAKDFPVLDALLRKWQRLSKYEDFHPAESMLGVANRAQTCFQEEARRQALDQQFESALQSLRLALDRTPDDLDELERSWTQLVSCNRPVPEVIEAEVTELLETLRDQRRRQRHRRAMVALVSTVILLGLLTAGGLTAWRTWSERRFRTHLATLWQYERLDELQTYIRDLEQNQPTRFNQPIVQDYLARLEARHQDDAAKVAAFDRQMGQLAAIRDQSYALPTAQIAAQIDRSRLAAATEEQKTQVDAWEQAWGAWRAETQERRDSTARQSIDRLLAKITSGQGATDLSADAELKLIKDARALQQQGHPSVAEASAAIRDAWQDAGLKLDAWSKAAVARQQAAVQAQAAQRQALANLHHALTNLDSYADTLKAFIAANPGTPDTAALKKALAEKEAYADALALSAFEIRQMPDSKEGLDQLKRLLDNLPGKQDSVWYRDLKRCFDYSTDQRKIPAELAKLRQLSFYDLKQLRMRPKGEEEWQTLYFPKTFHQRDYETVDGVKATEYWGSLYVAEDAPGAPRLEHRNFKSVDVEVEVDPRPENNLVPGARFINEFLLGLPDEPYLDTYLLKAIGKLAADPAVAPLPKAELISEIAKVLANATPFARQHLEDLAALFEGIPLNVPWVNPQHPQARDAAAAVVKRLAKLPDLDQLAAEIALDRWLCQRVLSNRVQTVGVVIKAADSGKIEPAFSRTGMASVWALQPGRPGTPATFTEVLVRTVEGGFQPAPEAPTELTLGQVLFAPASGTDPASLLRNPPGDFKTAAFAWPWAWPTNARKTP